MQVLTEGAIYEAVLKLINTAKPKEHLDLSMFYLSERKIIKALKSAQERGVIVRVLLDPNKDAFGRQRMVFQTVRWLQSCMLSVFQSVGVILMASRTIAK